MRERSSWQDRDKAKIYRAIGMCAFGDENARLLRAQSKNHWYLFTRCAHQIISELGLKLYATSRWEELSDEDAALLKNPSFLEPIVHGYIARLGLPLPYNPTEHADALHVLLAARQDE